MPTALGCPRLHTMAGLVHHGADRTTYVANLKKAAKLAAKQGVDLIIEPINTRDIPGFFLNTTDAMALDHPRGGRAQRGTAVRPLSSPDHGGRRRRRRSRSSGRSRRYADRAATRPRRTRQRRDQLSLSVQADRRQSASQAGSAASTSRAATRSKGLAWVERCGQKLG